MGMYTALRFEGTVKQQFRYEFERIALLGEWKNSCDEMFKQFSAIPGAGSIPCGGFNFMPSEWETAPYDKYGRGRPADGFETTYNEENGYWIFQCSLKNHSNAIEKFFDLVPYFMASVETAETWYEEYEFSKEFIWENGKLLERDE